MDAFLRLRTFGGAFAAFLSAAARRRRAFAAVAAPAAQRAAGWSDRKVLSRPASGDLAAVERAARAEPRTIVAAAAAQSTSRTAIGRRMSLRVADPDRPADPKHGRAPGQVARVAAVPRLSGWPGSP